MASVKVAVRARPFNQREIDMKSSEIIRMDGNKTCIENLKFQSLISCPNIIVSPQGGSEELGRERIKEFTFDYSYWSVHPSDQHFVTQEQVFNDLGQEVVDNAFEGYNACIFAYGQTGSGKTFTMMGSSDNEGLIPRICQAMYTRMKLGQNSGTTFRTEVSYLEIYNEKVKDLLKRESTQHNLRVREHPKLGPYVQDLSRHLVMDYSDVEELMARGNAHRTTASTAMNDVSSRSHAIFTLNFTQAKFIRDLPSETVSKVNLVDLAGSERADSTKATGQRLKEGGHINKSLVTLGTVISALAELSTSHSRKRVFIPYRDSVLTWLLRDSLGGNSKTIMIATISPAECNYGETLSTLRYANRAKNIINKPTINEDPNVKLIKELREEIARLRSKVEGDDSSTQVMEKLQENEARVKFLTEEWTEKWKETHKILKEQKTLGLRMSGQGVVLDSERPHLIGLGDDILSTGVVLYHLKDGKTFIGTENAVTKQDIVLSGSGIQDEHCSIELVDGAATLYPNANSECCINTMPVDKPTRLTQGCVVLLGSTNVFRYNDPAEVHKLRKEKERRSLMNLSHLSFLSRSAGDMSKSTESICGNGFEAHEDGSEKIMDMSMRKLLEKQSGNYEEHNNNSSIVAPLSKEQEAVEAQLSQKREELRQLQEKTEELKRMADEAHRKAEEEQTKLENVTEELRRHLEKQASEEQGTAQRIVQLQQELRYLTAKEKEVRENFEQLKNRLQQERVYVLSKLETEQSRLYDEIKSLEMKEQDLKDAIAKQQQELARVEEEVSQKKDEYSSQTNLLQDEIHLLKDELVLSTTQASENWRSLLSLISGARDDLPLPKNTGDLENIVESIRQQLADKKHAQLAEIHEERQSIAGQIEALAEKQKLLQSFADEASPDEDGSGDREGRERKGHGRRTSGEASSNEKGGGADKLSSDESDSEEVSTLVKGRLAFVGEEVRKLQEEEQALGRKEEDVEVGWRHNLDTLDSLLPLLESMVEDLDKLEGCISEKEQDVADIESSVNQCDSKLSHCHTEKENLEQQLQKVQDRKVDADTEQKELKTSLNSLDDKMAFLAQQEEDILSTLKNKRQRVEEELSKFSNGNDPLIDALGNGSQLSSPAHNESYLLSCSDNLGPLTSSPISNKLHHSSWDLSGLEEKYLVIEKELEERRKAFDSERGEADNVCLKQLREMEFKHQEELLELIKEKAEDLKRHNSGLYPLPCDGNSSTLPGRRQNITSRSLPILPTHPYLSFERGTEECPIRISIPSYTLRGSGSNAHIEYEVKVVVMDDSWTLYRRYKRFRELHDYMKLKYGQKVMLPYFPPKLLFGNKSQRLVEERRKLLEVYLIELINKCRRDLSCPLHRTVQGLCKQHMWEFAPFFRKGCFETSKHSTG
ncbi:kinesin-like protein KIF16B isoform X1 [Dermacentor albipictus]|uniref:kinesin-like protein KIF16B isoform X1 n=1 Tax=Dermacentor albipictus TaxID=60249 RepID=UPI0038FC654D